MHSKLKPAGIHASSSLLHSDTWIITKWVRFFLGELMQDTDCAEWSYLMTGGWTMWSSNLLVGVWLRTWCLHMPEEPTLWEDNKQNTPQYKEGWKRCLKYTTYITFFISRYWKSFFHNLAFSLCLLQWSPPTAGLIKSELHYLAHHVLYLKAPTVIFWQCIAYTDTKKTKPIY